MQCFSLGIRMKVLLSQMLWNIKSGVHRSFRLRQSHGLCMLVSQIMKSDSQRNAKQTVYMPPSTDVHCAVRSGLHKPVV